MKDAFEVLREVVRGEVEVVSQGPRALVDWIERFAAAVALSRLHGETCGAGYRDTNNSWQAGYYPPSGGGEYSVFDLRISISDAAGQHLAYIYPRFIGKLDGPHRVVIHSSDLKHVSVGRTAHIVFADAEAFRFDRALNLFDDAIRHLTAVRLQG